MSKGVALPCPICKGVEGCDHTVPERLEAHPTRPRFISFWQFVLIGKSQSGASIVNDVPWSFDYMGAAVTHESDDLYFITQGNRTLRFERGDLLVTLPDGSLHVMSKGLVPEEGGWFLPRSAVNDLVEKSLNDLIARAKQASLVDVDVRANGQHTHHEADWVKYLVPTPIAPVPVRQEATEDFCYCGEEISLQMVSGGAAPEGLYGRVTLKIGGEYVEYVRKDSVSLSFQSDTRVMKPASPETFESLTWVARLGMAVSKFHEPSVINKVSVDKQDEIIKRLMTQLGQPDSHSHYSAFKQFANEICHGHESLVSIVQRAAAPGSGATTVLETEYVLTELVKAIDHDFQLTYGAYLLDLSEEAAGKLGHLDSIARRAYQLLHQKQPDVMAPVDHDLKGRPIHSDLAKSIAERPVPIPGVNDSLTHEQQQQQQAEAGKFN